MHIEHHVEFLNVTVGVRTETGRLLKVNPLAPELFFLILAHSVYKM